MLPTRKLGPFTVSAIGLGCMNLSHAYDIAPSETDAARLLNRALDLGVTLLDTAALYGGGENERLIGRAVMHRRHEFTLASKCALDMVDGKRVLDGRPAAIARTLDAALERLGTDHIDLYYLHRLDAAVPIEDSVGALVRAKEAGKIGAIGLSEMSADTLRRAHAVHPIAAMQTEYSPMVRNVEIAVLDATLASGTALVAFSPLSRGLLSGAIRSDRYAAGDIRLTMPRFTGAALAHNLKLIDRFIALAATAGVAPSTLALAWGLARAPHVIPLPGTRSETHLVEDLQAATTQLSPGIVAEIDAIFVPGAIQGRRYAPAMQAQVDTELLPEEVAGTD
jgi:aryl-alcohol dehydrogenase-like predicted oxidoreductase